MTTFQQAIDYVNSCITTMFPGSLFRYSTSLNSTDKITMLGVQELLNAGHTVDTIPPTGREPAEIYHEAIKRLQVLSAQIDDYQTFNAGKLNTPVGRVYMAMLDNPPKALPTPEPSASYQQGLEAGYKQGIYAGFDMAIKLLKEQQAKLSLPQGETPMAYKQQNSGWLRSDIEAPLQRTPRLRSCLTDLLLLAAGAALATAFWLVI